MDNCHQIWMSAFPVAGWLMYVEWHLPHLNSIPYSSVILHISRKSNIFNADHRHDQIFWSELGPFFKIIFKLFFFFFLIFVLFCFFFTSLLSFLVIPHLRLCMFILFILCIYNSHCLFIVYCLQCMHPIQQDKFLVGVKSLLVIYLFLILILMEHMNSWRGGLNK